MASAATASTMVQTEPAMEEKAPRPRPFKSFTNALASMTIGQGVPESSMPSPASPGATLSHSSSLPLDCKKSPTGASGMSDDSTLVGPDDDKDGEQLVQEAAAFVDLTEKIPDNLPRLPKPILIPRLERGATPPLDRAWPPEAANHAIEQRDFITFIDNLNIVSRTPPISAILHIAAVGISVIPWEGADGIAALTELSALALAHAIVAGRQRSFLAKMNASYFHPRRLHARLVENKAMRRAVGIEKDDPLVAPLSEETLDMSAHDRCMTHMRAYTCELSHDVPESPSAQTQILERFSAWKVRHDVKVFDKAARKARKRSWKKQLKGKKVKREGCAERSRAKRLQWLLIQNLDEFEVQEAERIERAELKKAKRGFSWKSQTSTKSNEEDVKKG